MQSIQVIRIKSAGRNIINIAVLFLVLNIFVICAYLVISNVEDLQKIKNYYFVCSVIFLLISFLILFNLFNAGNNLQNCDLEMEYNEGENQIVFRKTTDDLTLKIISQNYSTIGAQVFIEEKMAPDGTYSYMKEGKKFDIIIVDGKITSYFIN